MLFNLKSVESTGRDSDKRKKINIFLAFAAYEHCVTIKQFYW